MIIINPKHCKECPFFRFHINGSSECGHPDIKQHDKLRLVHTEDTPPEACPLRTEPALIKYAPGEHRE